MPHHGNEEEHSAAAGQEPIEIRDNRKIDPETGKVRGNTDPAHEDVRPVDEAHDAEDALAQAEQILLEFLAEHVPAGKSPLCGNTISQDRRFMYAYMPNLERFFHYRNLDVSTLKELARRWAPAVYKGFDKKSRHEALADIYESIDELKYYREHLLKV